MGRIAEAFARAKGEDRAALVIYLCAGDPEPRAHAADLIVAAAEAGADVVEVGMPFSDPTADGPTIQRASERALARRRHPARSVLDAVRATRERTDVPIVLFGYYNPILRLRRGGARREQADGGGRRWFLGRGSAARGARSAARAGRMRRGARLRPARWRRPARPSGSTRRRRWRARSSTTSR